MKFFWSSETDYVTSEQTQVLQERISMFLEQELERVDGSEGVYFFFAPIVFSPEFQAFRGQSDRIRKNQLEVECKRTIDCDVVMGNDWAQKFMAYGEALKSCRAAFKKLGLGEGILNDFEVAIDKAVKLAILAQ